MEPCNTLAHYVALWRRLEDTRLLFRAESKFFCIRRVLQEWLGSEATDDLIFEVCNQAEQCGYDPLPLPALYPLPLREFLRAYLQVCRPLGSQIHLPLLDKAYSEVFPQSPPLNVWRKKLQDASVTRHASQQF